MGLIETYTGHWLNPFKLDKQQVDIIDIAHALSLVCRFSGQCREFYSVAEHSIAVAKLVPKSLRLTALLHDAHEAYFGDTATPHKFPKLIAIENAAQEVIEEVFGVSYSYDDMHLVKQADENMKVTEAFYLMKSKGLSDGWKPVRGVVIPSMQPICMTPTEAEGSFLLHYHSYRRYNAALSRKKTSKQRTV